MAWERQCGQLYYTRSRRVAGKVTREYYGRGPDARLAAALDRKRREQKRLECEALQAHQARYDEACAPLNELIAVTELLVTAILLAEGYHRHDRGAWRRKRGKR
jgi:hypothetical protein